MKIISCAALVLCFIVLSSCSSSQTSQPPMVMFKTYEISAVEEHTDELETYQEWLAETNKQLKSQHERLQSLITSVESKEGKTELEIDLQYKLLEKMNHSSMQMLLLQAQMQKENQYHKILGNILKQRSDASKDIIRNMK